MTTQKKRDRPNWFLMGLIVGPILGVFTGELVWCVTGGIVLGIIAEGLRPKGDASDHDTDDHKNAA